MNLLVVGRGGREHAISKKLLEDSRVDVVYCAPGNPGMQKDGIKLVAIDENDFTSLIDFVKEKQVTWTFVGPEIPLVSGIVDAFKRAGLAIFGPDQAAAQIEGSKEFAKKIMQKAQVPTAAYRIFDDFIQAKTFVLKHGTPIVIKADGLASGKGVVVALTEAEAIAALHDFLEENKLGESGSRVVIEEFLEGQEFSLMAFVNGNRVYPMVAAQDHKRAFDGDKGPNTGGMGAYSPIPQIEATVIEQAKEEILLPVAQMMVTNGTPFLGILYAGLIATSSGPKVIEFNARFGDPETQVILPRLESSLVQIVSDLLENKEPYIHWSKKVALGVVIAADGYPENYEKGMPLPKFDNEETTIYYAGVKEKQGELLANGGRIFLMEATADTLAEAQAKVYATLDQQPLDKMFYRSDIGNKALN